MTDTTKAEPKLKREFIIDRQGKPFVLMGGLLDLAHQQGLRRIQTRIAQLPDDDNGQTAVVTAEVETERGTFSGIGDANPSNCSRQMLTVPIRLAETRAIARALRWATNIAIAAAEELGDTVATDDDDERAPAHHAPPPAPRRPPTPYQPDTNGASYPSRGADTSPPASDKQRAAIFGIGKSIGWSNQMTKDECQRAFGCDPDDLTTKQASAFITSLNNAKS